MSGAGAMWKGFAVFLISIVVGIITSFALGYVTDSTLDGLDNAGVFNITDPNWAGFYDSTTVPAINIFYLICYAIPITGLAIFIFTCFKQYWASRRED